MNYRFWDIKEQVKVLIYESVAVTDARYDYKFWDIKEQVKVSIL